MATQLLGRPMPDFELDSIPGQRIAKVRVNALRILFQDEGYNAFRYAKNDREMSLLAYWAIKCKWSDTTLQLGLTTYKWARTKAIFDKIYAKHFPADAQE